MQKSCLAYPVEFVDDVFGASTALAETLRRVSGSEKPRVMIVADLNVVQRTEGLGAKIGAYFQANGITLLARPVVIGGGERVKVEGGQNVLKVAQAVFAAAPESDDCLIALGGGTLFDIAGYVAAQVGGGLKTVRVPTTPAAMIEAAFAEYAAIDLVDVKDALRVPARPAAVIVDTAFASTVLDGVWRGGFSEALRLAAVRDGTFLKKLPKLLSAYVTRDPAALKEIVTSAAAVRMKKGGSTFGLWAAERLEEMSGFKLPHGYSIAIGICLDSAYALEKGNLKEKDRESLVAMLGEAGILEGLRHSRHLLTHVEEVLFGLDRWRRMTGSSALTIPAGVGKSCVEETPDREIYTRLLKRYAETPAES